MMPRAEKVSPGGDPLAGFEETATYVYQDLAAEPAIRVIRYYHPERREKTFRQHYWDDQSQRWIKALPEGYKRPLFRLPELAASKGPVIIVEGEKDVIRLEELGFLATTVAGGCNAVDKVESWEVLQDRDIAILQDNDLAGFQFGRSIVQEVGPLARSVKLTSLPGVAAKGDLSDWADAVAEDFRDRWRRRRSEDPPPDLVTKEVAGQLKSLIDGAFPLQLPEKVQQPAEDRVFIERAFICAAWDHPPTAEVLSTFDPGQFRDGPSSAAAKAIRQLTINGVDLDPIGVLAEMTKIGQLSAWKTLEAFQNERLYALGLGRSSTYRAFRDACNWDDGEALVVSAQATLRRGDFKTWISRLTQDTAQLLARSETAELRTLKQHCEDWLRDFLADKPNRKTFRLAHLSDVIGEVGGGDVVPLVGAPKTGKSSVLMEIVADAAERGVKCLVGQLELRMEQVVERAVAKITGKPIRSRDPHASLVNKEDAARLLESGELDHLNNIFFTTRCTSLDRYRSEVASILAKHPDIKLWATDYAECIQNFGGNANRVSESEAIAKMKKDTCIAFDVAGLLLIQPNQEYTREGASGPRTYHVKNSSKWEQDAQALVFIHSPARFYTDMPRDYIELHVLCSRDSEPGVIPMKWSPSTFSYQRWTGPVPAGGGRTLKKQTEMDNFAAPKPEFEELDGDDFPL